MQLSIHFKRPTLHEVGVFLIGISLIYFVVGSPVFAYSGPNPKEAEARAIWKMMWHLMICLPALALGIMWAIRGRKQNRPKGPGRTFHLDMSLRKEDVSKSST